jgi:hypothetical protein
MAYACNRPMLLSSVGVTAKLRVTAMPTGRGASVSVMPTGPGAAQAGGWWLTVNDAASLAAANLSNMIFSAPRSALIDGQTIDLGTTSNGLVVSSMPPGTAIAVDFQ